MSEIDRRTFLAGGLIVAGGGLVAAVVPERANAVSAAAPAAAPQQQEISGAWTFQAANEIPDVTGESLSTSSGLKTLDPAVVPGTPLTSMIDNNTYPDPFYQHIVTDTVPDTLKDTDYWYRTEFEVPKLVSGQRFFLRFDGINYTAQIWLDGESVGTIEGAFTRGIFDVTDVVSKVHGRKARTAYLAVRIGKLDYSEGPLLPSYASGVTRGGRNGGPTGITIENGPTFFCTSGWDWLPTIPDRDLGIWQPVSWFTTGQLRIQDVRVDTTLADDLRTADVSLGLTIHNAGTKSIRAVVSGTIDKIKIRARITVDPGTSTVTLTPADVPKLRLKSPKLWWPNGYGDQYLHSLRIELETDGVISDERALKFGVRRIDYVESATSQQLRVKINNLPILVMGGNWGLDDALKRIPRERLFDQVRLHRDANLNLIRNWNGQSTSEDFYAACDEYGILVWQDFFYSSEGPAAANIARDVANIRDCIINYRNHPSILLWCGGNEASPPQELVTALDGLVAELDPKRACLTSSAGDTGANAITGYSSGGPYHWVSPSSHFEGVGSGGVRFHNEIGSYSIPTLEFIQAMIPETSWETPNNFWADRDVNANGGNGGGKGYIALTDSRYGDVQNLPDFARKSQLMNYEAIKSIFESHAAAMLGPATTEIPAPVTGVIMWMSNPAQPSFVWQMYSHDLEAHSSFYAVQHGCRRLNVILNAATRDVTVANHTGSPVTGKITAKVYNLAGDQSSATVVKRVKVPAASFATVANLASLIADATSDVCFVQLTMSDKTSSVLAENFYWHEKSGGDSSYAALDTMVPAVVSISARSRSIAKGQTEITVEAKNVGKSVALMVHLQVFDKKTGERILPVSYSDNYLNLPRGSASRVRIVVPKIPGSGLRKLAIRVDGWKLDQAKSTLRGEGLAVVFNDRAMAVNPPEKTFGVIVGKAHSGSWAYYAALADDGTASLARTVNLTGITGPVTWTSWLLYDTESGYDFIELQVSADGGTTWTTLGDRMSGASSGWTQVTRDLSAQVGHVVQLRYLYTTDSSNSGVGVYLDDVRVTAGTATVFSDDIEVADTAWTEAGFARTRTISLA